MSYRSRGRGSSRKVYPIKHPKAIPVFDWKKAEAESGHAEWDILDYKGTKSLDMIDWKDSETALQVSKELDKMGDYMRIIDVGEGSDTVAFVAFDSRKLNVVGIETITPTEAYNMLDKEFPDMYEYQEDEDY
jgi:hypothetical protein